MKRILAIILVAAVVLSLLGWSRKAQARNAIFDLVENNYDAILKACEEQDTDALYAIEGISKVKVAGGYVLAYCRGAGIAPSSQDYGFYYASENNPAAVDCNLDILCHGNALTPKGNGFQLIDNGHNVFYTELIRGNFYFYSNEY